jgi:hypothetical protein
LRGAADKGREVRVAEPRNGSENWGLRDRDSFQRIPDTKWVFILTLHVQEQWKKMVLRFTEVHWVPWKGETFTSLAEGFACIAGSGCQLFEKESEEIEPISCHISEWAAQPKPAGECWNAIQRPHETTSCIILVVWCESSRSDHLTHVFLFRSFDDHSLPQVTVPLMCRLCQLIEHCPAAFANPLMVSSVQQIDTGNLVALLVLEVHTPAICASLNSVLQLVRFSLFA